MGASERDYAPEEQWLGHAAALRSLAAALTSNVGEADDLVQETWLHGLQAGELASRPAPWWSAVLRNLVRDRARGGGQRARTEREAARAERLPSEVEVLERLELAQRLAAEVARLDEPYRTAIHLRYFEGLSPGEIALRASAPLETVRARLRRGLKRLRERMDRASGGDRSAWSVGLAAIATPSKTAAAGSAAAGWIVTFGALAMSAKIASVVLLTLAVGAGAFFLRPKSEASSPAPDAAVAEADAAPGSIPGTEAPRSEPPPLARVAAAQEVAGVPPAAANDDGRFEVRGTVVIVDETGVEHRDLSGTFLAQSGTSRDDFQSRETSFAAGAWSLRIPKGASLGFRKLIANGREALLPSPSRLEPGADPIEVRGRWLKRGRLRVVDAATKRDLRDIELRYSDRSRGGENWTHPGDSDVLEHVLRFDVSPFDLPERMRFTAYWLHAPGFAWTRVDFDHEVGGERTVELADPASVSVTISGSVPPPDAHVRLYSTKGVSFQREMNVSVRAVPNGPTRIDELAPGSYVACVEVGDDSAVRRLGESPVILVARETALVEVALDPGKLDVPMVQLFGTLALPEGTETELAALILTRKGGEAAAKKVKVSEMTLVDAERRIFEWDAGSLRTGTWTAQVYPPVYHQVIHAEEPGKLRVEIVIPELVTATLQVTDAESGVPLTPERIHWSNAKLEGISLSISGTVMALKTAGSYRLAAPKGVVQLWVDVDGYVPVYTDIDLTGDRTTFDVKLQRASGVRIQVFDGETRLRAGFMFFDGVRCTAVGERRPVGRPGGSNTEFEITRLLDPGRYEVKFPALEGYEPIETVQVEVVAGQILDVPVRVKHRP